jgi:hypothetical protein
MRRDKIGRAGRGRLGRAGTDLIPWCSNTNLLSPLDGIRSFLTFPNVAFLARSERPLLAHRSQPHGWITGAEVRARDPRRAGPT